MVAIWSHAAVYIKVKNTGPQSYYISSIMSHMWQAAATWDSTESSRALYYSRTTGIPTLKPKTPRKYQAI